MEPALLSSQESFFDDEDNLPKTPAVLRVDKKEIFNLAAKELKLTIHEEITIEINDDMYQSKVKIGKVLCRESKNKATKEFSGKPAATKKMSIQNAYRAVLQYLEDNSLVTIDDHNACNVSELKKQLLYSSSWAMLFEYKTKKLNDSIRANQRKLRDFLCSFDSFTQDASASFALLDAAEASMPPRKKARHQSTSQPTTADAGLVRTKLSSSLATLRDQLLSLVDSADHESIHLQKEDAVTQKHPEQ